MKIRWKSMFGRFLKTISNNTTAHFQIFNQFAVTWERFFMTSQCTALARGIVRIRVPVVFTAVRAYNKQKKQSDNNIW